MVKNEMTEKNWRETLQSLCKNGEFDEMWQLAKKAPAALSKQLLLELDKVKWSPPQERERDVFRALLCFAKPCVEETPRQSGLALSEGVNSLAISPDGRILASSGSGDKTVRLWGLPDGAHLCTLEGHSDSVGCLAISLDSKILASGSRDKTVRLWRLPGGKHLCTLKGHSDSVGCLAISPDGNILASGSDDKTIRLWGLPSGEQLCALKGHSDPVGCLAISPDGKILASGSGDKTLGLWELHKALAASSDT